MSKIPLPHLLQLLLVEDDAAFAHWVEATLRERLPGLDCTIARGSAEAAALLQARAAPWDLAIVDMNLGEGEGDGVHCISQLLQRWPGLPVLVVTSVDTPRRALEAIRVGAQGYVLKFTDGEELLRVVWQVLGGGSPITPSIARQLLLEFRRAETAPSPPEPVAAPLLERLSPREAQVLQLLARGYSNKEIALDVELALTTVDTHVRSIYHKLNVNSRAGLRRSLGL